MALVEKADRHAEQAREILIRALGYEPLHAAAHYNLALLYDEAGETGRAYSHYNDFLRHAGPEYGTRLSDVQRRVDAIAPSLDR
jgi:tetratricopeptide (TPR) repeat protein